MPGRLTTPDPDVPLPSIEEDLEVVGNYIPAQARTPHSTKVMLELIDLHWGTLWFKVPRTTRMDHVMRVYCSFRKRNRDCFRFFYKGCRLLKADDNAQSLLMEDNDEIIVVRDDLI